MTTNSKPYTLISNKETASFLLALTIPDNITPITVNGYSLSWSLETLAKFELIKKSIDKQYKNLPYTSLKGLLQIYFDNLMFLDSAVNLKYTNISDVNEIKPFTYFSADELDITSNFRTCFKEWIGGYLRPFVKKDNTKSQIIDELEELLDQQKLITISPINSQVLPWKYSKQTETTDPNDQYSFKFLIDFIAKQIAGKEIFTGCGTMKRIISGNSNTGQAELMTNPISFAGKKGKFSLVIKLEIITFPSVHQPVLKIDVSKRRWLYDLKNAHYGAGNIKGYIFSNNYSDRTFQYTVLCESQKEKWQWNIDQDFEPLRRKFNINLEGSAKDIALGKANSAKNQVVLTFHHGIQEKYDMEDGVPEIDKIEAFEKISVILKSTGFIPFSNYEKIKGKHPENNNSAGMIKFPFLLGAIFENLEKNINFHFQPEYFSNLSQDQQNELLQRYFQLNLADIDKEKTKKNNSEKNDSAKSNQTLEEMITANTEALKRLYPNELLQLIIFYEDDLKTDFTFVKTIAQIIWGRKVEIKVNSLPKSVHGSQKSLPGNKLNAKERSKLRIQEWEKITQQLNHINKTTFCLILAREWYGSQKDDFINKPSTRQALASLASSAVQFLLPIEINKQGKRNLPDYFHRVQSALKDLFSAHSGRFDNIQDKVNTYLNNTTPEKRPKEIIGITIVRKQRGRVRGHLEQTYLLIAVKIDVETGICHLCCAYQNKKGNLEISPWLKFINGLAFISKISPVKLADKKEIAKIRFNEFLNQVISDSLNTNPLIIIDSSNCVKLCPWLKDKEIRTTNIDLSQQYMWMEKNWEGARIIRVRQDLAPGFVVKKVREYAETSLDDTRNKEQLKQNPNYQIPSASSPASSVLLRLNSTSSTGCFTYLSLGKKTLHHETRGQSCYRETEIGQAIKNKGKQVKNQANLTVAQMSKKPPITNKFPTPNPLEIVVTLKQPDDNPDDLANLVAALRYGYGHYGEWSTLPAPLFFERVVRDYISDFTINDEPETQEESKQLSFFD